MSYPLTTVKRSGRAYAPTVQGRSKPFRARKQGAGTTARPLANSLPAGFASVRPGGQEWEHVQKMFLSSRAKFVGLAYSVLRNKEDAEDAVQDAILSAFIHFRSFEGRAVLTTWFTRIVLNSALMIRRKRKSALIGALPESGSANDIPWTDTIPDSQPNPEMIHAEAETFQLINVLLKKMSPVLRQALTLTYYDEKSCSEAGALLGVATGTFKSRLFRARRILLNLAQRSLVAPIRSVKHSPFPFGKDNFHALTPRSRRVA